VALIVATQYRMFADISLRAFVGMLFSLCGVSSSAGLQAGRQATAAGPWR